MKKILYILLLISSFAYGQTVPTTAPPANPQQMLTNSVFQDAVTKKYYTYNGLTFLWHQLTDSIQVARMISNSAGGGITAANNGLTDSSGTVQQGGIFTKNTTFGLDNNIIEYGDNNGYFNFGLGEYRLQVVDTITGSQNDFDIQPSSWFMNIEKPSGKLLLLNADTLVGAKIRDDIFRVGFQNFANYDAGIMATPYALTPFKLVDSLYARSSLLSGYVTLNTVQTITAKKTFGKAPVDSITYINNTRQLLHYFKVSGNSNDLGFIGNGTVYSNTYQSAFGGYQSSRTNMGATSMVGLIPVSMDIVDTAVLHIGLVDLLSGTSSSSTSPLNSISSTPVANRWLLTMRNGVNEVYAGFSASEWFQLLSNRGAFVPNRLSTTQRNAIVSGNLIGGGMIFNTDSLKLQLYNGTTWQNIGGSSGSGSTTYPLTNGYGVKAFTFNGGTTGIQVVTDTAVIVGKPNLASQMNLKLSSVAAASTYQPIGNYIIGLTGDGTASGPGSSALTLATVNSNVGSFGDATHVSAVTLNGKGLATAVSSIAITFPVTLSNSVALTNKDLTGAGNTFPTFNQNTTGNAATVTTNANLTGPVTSIGNTTTITPTAVTAGTYTNTNLTVGADGRITAASNGSSGAGTVSSIATSTGILGGTITTTGTLKADTTVLQTILNFKPLGNTYWLLKNATTLPSSFLTSSLTSVGTLGSLNVTGTTTAGLFDVGTLTYTATNPLLTLQSSVNGFNQLIIQNSNSGSSASSDVVVNNNNSTNTTYYGDFGMNSSGFTGTGAFNQPNNVYLTATTGDLAIGTTTANAIHLVVNGGTTDAMTIASTGAISLPGLSTGVLHSSSVGLLTSSLIAVADLSASGTPSSTTYLRGDNTWATVSGGISGLTTNYVTKAASSSSLTNGLLYDDGTGIMLGTTINSGFAWDNTGTERIQGNLGIGKLVAVSGTPTATPSTTGGTLAANTYYYKIVAVDINGGTTTGSTEVSATTTGTTSSVALAWAQSSMAQSYRIYRGTTSGGESVYYSTSTSSGLLSFTDVSGTSTAGTVPTLNTSASSYINTNGAINGLAIGFGGRQNSSNIVIGVTGSGSSITTGASDIIMGNATGTNVTTGSGNALFGQNNSASLTTGSNNTTFGNIISIPANSQDNIVVGNTSGSTSLGSHNTLLGNSSAGGLTGTGNVFVGDNTGASGSNTTSSSVFLGYFSGSLNTSGQQNTNIGFTAMYGNTTGGNNTSLGYYAGRQYTGGLDASIQNNSVYLGSSTGSLGNNQTNQIVIGYNLYGNGSNTVTIGNSSIIGTYLTGLLYFNGTAGTNRQVPLSNGTTMGWVNLDTGLITGTPTIAAGAGAGTSPTVTVTTNGKQLQVTVTTGTLPTGTNATIATVTLPNALSYTPYPVFSSPPGAATLLSAASMIGMSCSSGSSLTITSGTTALTAATTYVWNVVL